MNSIRSLLNQMNLEEKIAQLQAIPIDALIEEKEFSEEKAKKYLKLGIGQITRVAGSRLGLKPKEVAKLVNKIQKFLVENTRMKIPAIIHEECLSGLMGYSSTAFPQAIGLASTWNLELVMDIASVIRSQARLVGVNQCLSPVLDVCKDPRWGRCEETYGEDPYLVASMGLAYITGLQGDNQLVATAKHFAAHGFPEGGRNIAQVHVGNRELRETFLFPFEVAVKIGKVMSIMPAYHEIDGIPCHGNPQLLTNILRQEWGFDGIVVSDYDGIRQLETIHRVASNKMEAAILALESGVDIEFPTIDCYSEPLVNALTEGLVPESLIDRAVERVLRIKDRLGLLDNPFVNENSVPEKLDDHKSRELALKTARESIVLLKNENNILPLSKNVNKIAVIGPNANDPRNMLGDYTYTGHLNIDSGIEIVTVLQGVVKKVGESKVLYAKGCDIASESKEGFAEAIEIARQADVIIAVMGEKSGLPLSWTDIPSEEEFKKYQAVTGEGNDRSSLRLPGVQEELLKELYKTGKPIILVLINGRPLVLSPIINYVKAVIEAWFPGEEGGNAIADVIFGDYNPSGRLPITFPMDTGQIPLYYNRKPSSFRPYVMLRSSPLFTFGYGLSYTQFEYSNLEVTPKEIGPNSNIAISIDVKNVGKMEGDDVVQLYVSKTFSSVARPVKELKGFAKIHLKPGEKRRVKFILPTEALAFYDSFMRLVVEKGEYQLLIGNSSENIILRDIFRIKETKPIVERRIFLSNVQIE
ncbi:glycoside hydrolase family 3 N-terminal domain-containing protein [Saccharolobus islandicus]|uniref:Glycoside hydrolase family 3 domain protein n=1 Tax=Saccharolobus islandicus (strain REY15A) TaxID=930945 RepID=F0NCN8_SACI5|nr:glycoside hydrolase family 3 N-terminal domain-containing protein [Sulfolobus islandicus]ADX86262.1 glycoside hydrolase family 3 domain protein [Sulfolobus islandicus REY15A]